MSVVILPTPVLGGVNLRVLASTCFFFPKVCPLTSYFSFLCHLSVYRDSGQAHNQYSKETLSVTMLPVFLLVASLVIETGLSERRCLGYDVLCTTADYQFRRYNETVWLGTHVSNDMEAPNDLLRLYRYMWMEERKEKLAKLVWKGKGRSDNGAAMAGVSGSNSRTE
ncbi:uncharacterized protein LOC134342255 isoform X2 [Mobula hypostoma]|uniref:uncharacterized protein LOC134342255 isoform X2 n=1 Tax=Mobula hypostoma TaxID=723540 RepID=UPI002FC39DA4